MALFAHIERFVQDPETYALVMRHMVHGPCGAEINPNSPCMVEGPDGKLVCGKHYPMALHDNTIIRKAQAPLYRRRPLPKHEKHYKESDTKKLYAVDNRWIVPYNKPLLLKMKCHINCEIVGDCNSPKYLCMYATKGSDRVVLSINHMPVARRVEDQSASSPPTTATTRTEENEGRTTENASATTVASGQTTATQAATNSSKRKKKNIDEIQVR